tara:strand:+ start:8602 stop:10326 length:1725 start_codon:yes stop_codon:yes gene_type:complete
MIRNLTAALVAVLFIAACGGEQANEQAPAEQLSWAAFQDKVLSEYHQYNPELAVDAGLHEYDGMASDFSRASIDAYIAWLEQTLTEIATYEQLEGRDAFDRDYLAQALRGDLFFVRDSGFLQSNPVAYAGSLGFSVYVDREYAPLEERIRAYTTYISTLPGRLEQMRDNLQPPLPAPYVQTAYGMFSGLAAYLEDTVPGLFADVEDVQLQRQFAAANAAAAAAVQQTANWLDGLKETATDDYALGEQRFLQMLAATEGVNVTLEELKRAGAADLERNLDALRETCADYLPGASTADCVRKVQANKPPEGAVGGARRQLPALRKFVEDNNIVSIPGTEDALVSEAPPHKRFNSAYINIPGPYEKGLPSVYYIAPPDPDWSEEDQLAYIPSEDELLAISVHEVWPGHFLQFLHANRAESQIGRNFSTYTFVEGWAHYTEQMMVDAGLGDGDPEVKIGQLLNALLRNVRYMSAIGLHAEGMSVEESQQLFEEKAFQDFGNAQQQARRGTYDPGYLNYTLGKLMINKLRDDWTAGRGGREAWGTFHDAFLSYGSPPIPLIRKAMLGADYSGDESLLPN